MSPVLAGVSAVPRNRITHTADRVVQLINRWQVTGVSRSCAEFVNRYIVIRCNFLDSTRQSSWREAAVAHPRRSPALVKVEPSEAQTSTRVLPILRASNLTRYLVEQKLRKSRAINPQSAQTIRKWSTNTKSAANRPRLAQTPEPISTTHPRFDQSRRDLCTR